eukprot:652376-Rhodomonas_salina.7
MRKPGSSRMYVRTGHRFWVLHIDREMLLRHGRPSPPNSSGAEHDSTVAFSNSCASVSSTTNDPSTSYMDCSASTSHSCRCRQSNASACDILRIRGCEALLRDVGRRDPADGKTRARKTASAGMRAEGDVFLAWRLTTQGTLRWWTCAAWLWQRDFAKVYDSVTEFAECVQ